MPEKEYKTVLVAGGSGIIGKRLAELLESKSYHVLFLSHTDTIQGKNVYHWNPEKKIIDKRAIQEADVIINLAGAPIAGVRWTATQKRKIINSRIHSTNLLYETVSSTPNHVKLIINASAVGIYGNTKDLIMHEESPLSNTFLGQTCQRWENAACQFHKTGIRTVIFRIGIVLSSEGGMIEELLKVLKYGIAPYVGTGKQYHSWIHVDDLCRMMSRAIKYEEIKGIYNAVSPGPLSNKNIIKLLSQLLGGGHFIFRIPAIFLKLALGEMSTIILHGSRVSSKKIEATGFVFNYPQADVALRNILDK